MSATLIHPSMRLFLLFSMTPLIGCQTTSQAVAPPEPQRVQETVYVKPTLDNQLFVCPWPVAIPPRPLNPDGSVGSRLQSTAAAIQLSDRRGNIECFCALNNVGVALEVSARDPRCPVTAQ